MTNPDNTVGTNAGYDGRTTPNAFNDILGAFSRGLVSGWACVPDTGMTVEIGGDGTTRDVAIAEDNAGNRITINNRIATPVSITLDGAPATGNRIDLIVAYAENPPMGAGASSVDFPDAVGIIAVSGTPAGTPSDPDENDIRTAITADGATGATAYYVILARIEVGQGVTTIGSGSISAGDYAQVGPSLYDPTPADGSITAAKLASGAVTTAKIDANAVTQAKIDMASATTATAIQITDYFTPAAGWTFTGQMWKLGHFVFGTIESTHSITTNQNNIGTCSSHILYGTYGAGRVGDGSTSYAATALAIPNGQLRLHSTHTGASCAFTICVYVDN